MFMTPYIRKTIICEEGLYFALLFKLVQLNNLIEKKRKKSSKINGVIVKE